MNEKNIVALEIGSSKVKGAVGTVDENGVLTVKAVEEEPILDCVRYGIVSNAEEVAGRTNLLLNRLESRLNGRIIDAVNISIGGRSFRTDRRECERILPQEVEISAEIIEQLINETASTVSASRDLLEVVPYAYFVDKSRTPRPIGSLGSSIRMLSNIITCRMQVKRNLCHLINEKLGLKINSFVLRQLAIADFTLTPDEKRLGCMLVDCGAETTTVAIYKQGNLQYMVTLPMGSRNITRDLTHLNLVEEEAEDIKIRLGNAHTDFKISELSSGVDAAMVQRYISFRAGEIIANIKEQITLAGLKSTDLPAGIILVGRGARLAGFNERLAKASQMKVRFGNAARTDVRVGDPRISISDSLDVISTLYEVSRNNPVDCLVMPEIEPEIETEPQPEPEKKEEHTPVAEPEPKRTPSKNPPKSGKGWFSGIGDRLNRLLSEAEYDGDEDNILEDDE